KPRTLLIAGVAVAALIGASRMIPGPAAFAEPAVVLPAPAVDKVAGDGPQTVVLAGGGFWGGGGGGLGTQGGVPSGDGGVCGGAGVFTAKEGVTKRGAGMGGGEKEDPK